MNDYKKWRDGIINEFKINGTEICPQCARIGIISKYKTSFEPGYDYVLHHLLKRSPYPEIERELWNVVIGCSNFLCPPGKLDSMSFNQRIEEIKRLYPTYWTMLQDIPGKHRLLI